MIQRGVGWGGRVGKEGFPCGGTSRSVNLTTHIHLETNLKMHGAIFVFPSAPARNKKRNITLTCLAALSNKIAERYRTFIL